MMGSVLPGIGSRHGARTCRIVQDLRGDPAYVAISDFVAWSKGRYFFAAKASSPRTLAAFMQGMTK